MVQTFESGQENTHRVPLIAVSIVFTFFGTLIVLARLLVRGIVTKSMGRDDVVMFAAWVASIGFTIASSVAIRYGIGLFVSEINADQALKAIEATFYVELFYYFTLYLIKLSILLFYLRLVDGLYGKFYTCTLLCIGLITLHFISTLVVVFLQCRPISFYWNQDQLGSCININKFFYSTNGFTIASDLIILALPIPTLSRVNRSPREKLALLSVFGAGAISTIASCVRLYTIQVYTRSKDPLYDAGPITLWSFIEINLGIACASGPALKVVFVKIKGSVSSHGLSEHSAPTPGPSESQVGFGLQFPQPTPRKPSSQGSSYEFDALTGNAKATSTVSGGSRDPYDEETYQRLPKSTGEIWVHRVVDTRTRSVDLHPPNPKGEWNKFSET